MSATRHRPLRIAVLHFAHETVSFLQVETELQDFIYPGSPCRGEALLRADPQGALGGFVECAREYAGIELIGIESPLFPRTGIGSGWIARDAYEHFVEVMLRELSEAGPFDVVFMALHGAMAVRGIARPEAELARRVRLTVGTDAIIGATFDPHGNEDEEFLNWANFSFCAKYYPHYDMRLQGERAARALVQAARGTWLPTSATLKVPILSPTVVQWTGASPWMDLVQAALVWEARAANVVVNVFFGFPWADSVDGGMTVQVITNDDVSLANRIAQDVSNLAWRLRHALLSSTTVHTIEDGARLARAEIQAGRVPVVVADHSDRSGAATWLLKEFCKLQMQNVLFATIADPSIVNRIEAARLTVGDRFQGAVGGSLDISAGTPVEVEGLIVARGLGCDGTGSIADYVVLAIGRGNVLVVSTRLMQITELSMLEAMGLTLQAFDAVVLKSRVHFRKGFCDGGFAASVLLVEPSMPFLGTTKLDALEYRNMSIKTFYPYSEPRDEGASR